MISTDQISEATLTRERRIDYNEQYEHEEARDEGYVDSIPITRHRREFVPNQSRLSFVATIS